MSSKTIITGLFLMALAFAVNGQRIVVDSASSNKYLITPKNTPGSEEIKENQEEDLSFGDRALSIGKGILNRLKARLNLEEASESFKEKREKILGKSEEKKEEDG